MSPSYSLNSLPKWVWAILAVVVAWWIGRISGLMIADVWDETATMALASSDAAARMSLGEMVAYVWTHPLPVYRPLPATIVALGVRLWGDGAWIALRWLNAALLLACFGLFLAILSSAGRLEVRRVFLVALAWFGSASTLLGAAWFADLFDVSVCLLLLLGSWLILENKPLVAGLVFGLAFFCKEIAILCLPLAALLWAGGRVEPRTARAALLVALPFALLYFGLRQHFVPLGSEADIHGFSAALIPPTALDFLSAFWRQTFTGTRPWWGLGFLAFSLLTIVGWRQRVILLATLVLCITAYLGQTGFRPDLLIWPGNFAPRLFLVPFSLFLVALALDGRPWWPYLLLLPLLSGFLAAEDQHRRFQESYRHLYEVAEARGPLRVLTPWREDHSAARGFEIGPRIPNPDYILDERSGELIPMVVR